MSNIEKKIINTIQKYKLIEKGDKIVVGVSGGPDSMCLLDILCKLIKERKCQNSLSPLAINDEKFQNYPFALTIIVAHVNHMIREEAKDDENYVKDYCKKNNIDFYSKSIDVQKFANNNKIGTEEAGRLARYNFFNEVLEKTGSNKIAIAHNKNDKAETMIMNCLRGSGISGLKGIEPKRDKYIRPLIECERNEIEDYCNNNNLKPRIDKTNFENVYTRNKIRNIVIPYIKEEFNPNIINTLDRLSELVCEEDKYIENQVKKLYTEIIINKKNDEQIILDLKLFNKQEKVIKSRLVIYTITELLGNAQGIEKIHIEDIIKLCSNNIGNKYLTPNKKIKVLVKNHKIYFINQV